MNKLWSGSYGSMASALPMATLAASNQVWRRQSNSIGGTGGTGSGPKALSGSPPMRSSLSLPTWLPCHEVLPYWTKANNGDRYWRFGGKLHIGLPRRRSRNLFPAFRASHDSGSGRSGKASRAPVTSWRGMPVFPSHSIIDRSGMDESGPSMCVERIARLRT